MRSNMNMLSSMHSTESKHTHLPGRRVRLSRIKKTPGKYAANEYAEIDNDFMLPNNYFFYSTTSNVTNQDNAGR